MKNIMTFFLIGVFGLILGAWWPQSELSIAREEIEILKSELASRSKRSILPDMARMLTMPEAISSLPAKKSPLKTSSQKTPTPAPGLAPGFENNFDDPRSEDEFADELANIFDGAESTEDALETMADLWKTRRDIARSALADHLGLSDEEMDEFDSAMADMNDNLEDSFESLADKFADMGTDFEPSPEDAFRMANEFTGIFVDTYNDIDETLPDGWREDTSSPLDLTAFIDPYVLKPMIDLDNTWSK
ncbi:hypothetical protein K8T06_07535 [bacterium]|nr:hypothetical protein [bacterium]